MSRRKSRPKRGSMGLEAQLYAEQIDGLVARWVNDKPGRLDNFVEHGWEFRLKKGASEKGDGIDARISKFVGNQKDGTPMRAYLMDIDIDWYDEDQADKQQVNDRVDEVIEAGVEGVANSYIPTDGGKSPVTFKEKH